LLSILTAFGFLLLGFASSANAVSILYTFSATYHDGSTAAGDFLFETDTDTFSEIEIILDGGSEYPDEVFSFNRFQGPHFLVLLNPADGPGYDNDTVFHIILQDSGLWGELEPTAVYSDIADCDKDHCPARDNLDVAVSTSLVGVVVDAPVPEPSAVLLVATGFAGLVWRMRRR